MGNPLPIAREGRYGSDDREERAGAQRARAATAFVPGVTGIPGAQLRVDEAWRQAGSLSLPSMAMGWGARYTS